MINPIAKNAGVYTEKLVHIVSVDIQGIVLPVMNAMCRNYFSHMRI